MFKNFDWVFFLSSILILLFGIFAIYSTNPKAANQQFIFSLIGLMGYLLISFMDYRILKQFSHFLYFAGLLSLILVFIFGTKTRGSIRWFKLGGYGIQPSEFVKIFLILILARVMSIRRVRGSDLSVIAKVLGLTALLSIPVFLQPDLGTTLSLLFVGAFLLAYYGINRIYYGIFFILLGLASYPLWSLLKDYQKERIISFINPSYDPLGSGYHIIQSIIAVGSGGLFGKGYGSGTQSHLKYLPAYYTDFIFASFAEEWGLIGVTLFLILFFIMLVKILSIARSASDSFGNMAVMGVFSLILFQFFVSVGMNLGIMPVTGIPLPLFSYGGSSLITTLLLLGLVQSIAVHRKK